MPYTPPPELASLSIAEIAELAAAQKLPPVDQWDPQETGDSEMRIAADGTWYHQGDPIRRPAMVRAFSSILRREPDDSYALVTPYQKLSIVVEDAPFVAVELESQGSGADRTLAFRLNTDHLVVADADHPLQGGGGHDGQCQPVASSAPVVGTGPAGTAGAPAPETSGGAARNLGT